LPRADRLIDWIVCVEREHFLPGGIENDFAEGNGTKLLIFIQQPWDELIHGRVWRWRWLPHRSGRQDYQRD